MDTSGSPTWKHATSESIGSMKSLERTDTPSTVCDDEEMHSKTDGIATSSSLSEIGPRNKETHPEKVARKSNRGLNCHEFMMAVKAPFLFPRISTPTAVPVCIICTQALQRGSVCRELNGCGHCFHAHCVEQYFYSHSRCPVCRLRCRPSSRRHRPIRPCWTPDFDAELLNSNMHLYNRPLPTLLEESQEVLRVDDGSLLLLSDFLNQEKEKRVFRTMSLWNREMRKLAISFSVSLMSTLSTQLQYVSELTRLYKARKSFSSHIYN